jgi:uncharacterized protein (DUF58 family)
MPWPIPGRADPAGRAGRVEFDVRSARRVALAGLILALVGFAFVGPPLSAPGAGLCVLGVLAELWVRLAAAGLTLAARPVRETVIEGDPLVLEIVVSGSRLLGLGSPQLEHSLLSTAEPLNAISSQPADPPSPRPHRLQAPRQRRVQIRARTQRRGRMELTPPRLNLSDALGLARAVCTGDGTAGELLVLPRTEPVPWLADDTSGASVYAASSVAGREATDVVGLREYQLGTPASRIHWAALARGGELLERVFASETQMAPLVVIDPRTAGTASSAEALNAAIRATASLSLALARAGAVDVLLPGHVVAVRIGASMTAWPSVHQALALMVEASFGAPAPLVPRDSQGVLFYACSDPALVTEAQRRWAGRLWTVTPRLPGVALPPGAAELAGCVVAPHGGA